MLPNFYHNCLCHSLYVKCSPVLFYILCLTQPISQLLIRFLVRWMRAAFFSDASETYGRWCTDVLINWLLCLWSTCCSSPALKTWEKKMEGLNETETCPRGQNLLQLLNTSCLLNSQQQKGWKWQSPLHATDTTKPYRLQEDSGFLAVFTEQR